MTLALYTAYLGALEKTPSSCRPVPYHWSRMPSPLSAKWMVYSQMLGEFAGELANSINAFSSDVRRLSAWAQVIQDFDDQQKIEATFEFIDALATNALLFPYVIKSRFAFAAAHLSHQANMTWDCDWKDDLPLEDAIYLNTTDKFAAHWSGYNKFKRAAEGINGSAFKAGTGDFRNAYNHRFSPRFVIGMTGIVTRAINPTNGHVRYGFGGRGPLELPAIVDLLERERDRCCVTFKRFQDLVNEQTTAIEDHPSQIAVRNESIV